MRIYERRENFESVSFLQQDVSCTFNLLGIILPKHAGLCQQQVATHRLTLHVVILQRVREGDEC